MTLDELLKSPTKLLAPAAPACHLNEEPAARFTRLAQGHGWSPDRRRGG
jgi:hypothetical protein